MKVILIKESKFRVFRSENVTLNKVDALHFEVLQSLIKSIFSDKA